MLPSWLKRVCSLPVEQLKLIFWKLAIAPVFPSPQLILLVVVADAVQAPAVPEVVAADIHNV